MIATVRIGTLAEAPPVVVQADALDPLVTLTIGTRPVYVTRDEARRIGDALRACSLTLEDDEFRALS